MKRNRRRNIIIELTSLLDVILIMIFMVMSENSKLAAENTETLESVVAENAEMRDELDELHDKLGNGEYDELLDKLHAAESMLTGYDYLDDVVKVVDVSLENRYNNAVRCLTFGDSADQSSQLVSENRSDDEFLTAVNKLKVFLTEYINSAESDQENSIIVYIIFSYDTSKIYQDDFALVERALNEVEIKANDANVRFRFNKLN